MATMPPILVRVLAPPTSDVIMAAMGVCDEIHLQGKAMDKLRAACDALIAVIPTAPEVFFNEAEIVALDTGVTVRVVPVGGIMPTRIPYSKCQWYDDTKVHSEECTEPATLWRWDEDRNEFIPVCVKHDGPRSGSTPVLPEDIGMSTRGRRAAGLDG